MYFLFLFLLFINLSESYIFTNFLNNPIIKKLTPKEFNINHYNDFLATHIKSDRIMNKIHDINMDIFKKVTEYLPEFHKAGDNVLDMNQKTSKMIVLEEKIIGLLNKLKENHLSLNKYIDSNESLTDQNKILKKKLLNLEEENKSLKIANNLLGSKDEKSFTKIKISNLIKEVDQCIQHLSELE